MGLVGDYTNRETAPLGSRPGMGARCCWAQRHRPLSGRVKQQGWHSHVVHTHTQCIRCKHQKSVGSSAWAAGGPGWDRVGVRLAQPRGQQTSNTNQGDLVMDIRGSDREGFVFSTNCSPLSHIFHFGQRKFFSFFKPKKR